jgi:hypothetical protein
MPGGLCSEQFDLPIIGREESGRPAPRKALRERGIVLRDHGMPAGREDALRHCAANEHSNPETELQREGRLS